MLVSVPADALPLLDQVKGQSSFAPLITVPPRLPGRPGMFAVSHPDYGFICLVPDADGTGHHKKGMVSQLVVR